MKETHLGVSDYYRDWFLDYASYVILERAVPAIEDGLKPVQRRILHAMKEIDDGRYNKVANIIGQTMQFHPHGDASIGEALVNMGQKDLLIDTQGNWGDINTGDAPAAPRYIEARLSKFALEVAFNAQTTAWQLSYDGRKREPITLPLKFPLLLAQGVEGIAVGLSTKIMPHNFIELLEASIDLLKGKEIRLIPDFLTGGFIDASQYKAGKKGGKIRIRAKIEEYDRKNLIIKDIPYTTTTTTVIESIIKATDTGKIKIKKVTDNTAKEVAILVELAPNTEAKTTIDALYAFTQCEISISPNACIIADGKPYFTDVHDLLKINTDNTVKLLEQELQIKKQELLEKILYSSLEKIFIENRIYRNIEECETFEAVLQTIDNALEPFKKDFYRTITQEDILKLTEIRIKRISKYDAFKADEAMRKMQEELVEVADNLTNLVRYAINYFRDLLKKYGKGKERKTQITTFDAIEASEVVANNQKLYVNRAEGFIGYGLKKDEFICECSDLDDVLVMRADGKYLIKKIAEKVFVGKDILYVGVLDKPSKDLVYHAVYKDGKDGVTMVKKFKIDGYIREREYDLTKGREGSKLLYISAKLEGQTETLTIKLSPTCAAKIKTFEYNFASMEIKGKTAAGNILTKYPVKSIIFKANSTELFGNVEANKEKTEQPSLWQSDKK